MNNDEILQLLIYTASGFFTGFIIYKVLMPLFAKLATKTSIKTDDLIIQTIRKWVIPWCVALGLFLGLRRIEMDEQYHYWLKNALVIFYIFSLTVMTSKIISGLIKIKGSGPETAGHSSSIINSIVKVIIYCIGLLVILQSQGISITPMLTALGVGGLAVALALQNTLINLFAGLQIITSGRLNPGDFIRLSSGEEGYIEDINWRSTTIRGEADHMVIVPNSKLADMIVINYNLPHHELSFLIELGVAYDSDLTHVERVTKEVIRETLHETEGCVKDFEPVIRFFAFGESRISLRAILRVKEYSYQFAVKHEFIKRLYQRYQREGIRIPPPARTVYMENKEG